MARYTLIPEKGYATVMNQMIVPGLKPFHESGTLEVSSGHPIRWDYYSCPDARGSIIISHGFIESGFKFIEMVYYFRQMGLNVCTVDHRGHGHSYRAVKDPSTTDADRFYDYVDDLHGIITEILMKKGNGPYLLYAHSMGGAIGACYLKQHPGVISGAIFNAPMIRAQTGGLPLGVANAIAKTAIRFGQGKRWSLSTRSMTRKRVLSRAPQPHGHGLTGIPASDGTTSATATTAPAINGFGRRSESAGN